MKLLITIALLTILALPQGQVKKTSSVNRSFVATAYCLRGRMANGQQVHPGAIATDWRILPKGSKVSIGNMGTYVAKDTGGAIKGNRIDIWMADCKQAVRFGKRKVEVRVL